MIDTTSSDRVQITIDGRATTAAATATMLDAARADGHLHPHALQLPRTVALRRVPRLPRGNRYAPGTAAGGLVQLSGRRGPGRPDRYGSGAGIAPHRAGTAAGPGPAIAGTGRSWPRNSASRHAVGAGRRRQVHPLRAVRADVQRPDGPRRHQHVRPRAASEASAPAFGEPSDQCQACGACGFVCPTGAIDLATVTARRPQAASDRL